MNYDDLKNLKKRVVTKLSEYGKDGVPMDTACVESIYKLSATAKNLDKLIMIGEYNEAQQYNDAPQYDHYAGRHRIHTTRPMYDDGRDRMVRKLENMMYDTDDDHTRRVLSEAMRKLEN